AVDGLTPLVKPGQAVRLPVRLINTTGAPLGAGAFHVRVPAGWSVEPASLPTSSVAAGGEAAAAFTVTAAATLPADRLQPVIVRWRDASGDRAVMTKQLAGAPAETDIPRLLTANANYPAAFPYRVETGATYRYAAPRSGQVKDPVDPGGRVKEGQALQSGFGSMGGERNSFNRGGYVKSHYARYAEPVVEIVFDLQARRELARVNLVCGPEPVTLTRLQVLTSDDGETFAPQGEVAPVRPTQELELSLDRVAARYVKVRAEWPAAGGTLDEVELWGW
ncbi:MAG TPA: NEW3 domain-containing protein, partial [Opitutaceae bacterium]